ncbi:helix-turn-helix domain-containing protein [Domibacillus sp. A3M-37]|uniref:helix-turn-helix domain-containing protein n=1 Tax=Domibacillus sp. A3M-37 TaxID=2962037 RepID=UPI0020B64BCB|nr:MerR family transcriptional regulator [Domibacillus sp. A3M-37]MCP3763722.1 helix-turn-helix domain-containing protein [Domibacillus sp. A3M-37]
MMEIMTQIEDQRVENPAENLEETSLMVKETAKYVNESPGVIRNWMRELKTHVPAVQGENGYNYFNQPALKRLALICQLNRELGYSLKQIEYYLTTGGKKVKPEWVKAEAAASVETWPLFWNGWICRSSLIRHW